MNREEFQTERTRIISEMLDNPNEYGIYPTTKCFEQLDALFDSLSLPPAEGAEAIVKKYEDEYDFKFHWVQRDRVIRMMREFAAQQQPTAEGAEQIASDLSFTIGLLEAEIDSLKDAYKSDDLNSREYSSAILSHKTALKILKGNISQKPLQPTAEGAEEILRKNCNTCYSRSTGEEEVWSSVSSVLIAMQDFATFHAQRIAEKKYADTEAGGYVFCGKCGKMKEI